MKKLITVLLILVSMSLSAQDNQLFASLNEPTINLNLEKVNLVSNSPVYGYRASKGNNDLGPGMMVAGAGFLIGGLLTSTEQYGLSGPDKKFFENPARASAVLGGVILLSTGLVITITF